MKNNECLYCKFNKSCDNVNFVKSSVCLPVFDLSYNTSSKNIDGRISFDSIFMSSILCKMKTKTRRIIKEVDCQYHNIGDILYISEPWNYVWNDGDKRQIIYKSSFINDSNVENFFMEKT